MQNIANIQQAVLIALQELPLEKQQEVLNFVEFLKTRMSPKTHHSLRGLWADLQVDLTEAEITEAKHEIWVNFSKKIDL
jgi:tRNA C32,U32 (ribose-2'-O)-methylase TrmJ